MIKKTIMLACVALFALAASGCHTVYRTSKGAAEGAVSGAKQDYEEVKKTDAWIKDNLW
jgi:hypothetical protein